VHATGAPAVLHGPIVPVAACQAERIHSEASCGEATGHTRLGYAHAMKNEPAPGTVSPNTVNMLTGLSAISFKLSKIADDKVVRPNTNTT
jgi:hypothetical protein